MSRLHDAYLLMRFWYADWGAAKSEVLEMLRLNIFEEHSIESVVMAVLDGSRTLTPEERRAMKIIAGEVDDA